ncbi:unnamed protein product (macronuclear) [Paramecium tetraurelia]|uniref:Response regulatory domain-containing protein n=1 Tax=Paramecium tetraurelia TaxID=5888 RepID=A0DR66_PARTE|nr:uncharacterized protein GSPATT00019250001 [Paramecium tetraurelia]CAK85533.1 unnamed protein product [Paramecium tetraurelia]|eukprot:XP_001452930.1 hypothetical protein (macronuclear) [Paramecium tetraurelia strain d4-2]
MLLARNRNLNIYAQLAINVISVVAKQSDQFLLLQTFVGFALFLQNDQKRWVVNILTCLIQVAIICFYSQNNEIQSYLMSVFTVISVTYFYWAIKLPTLKKQSSGIEFLPLNQQNSVKSSLSVDELPQHPQNTIILENQILDIKYISNSLKDLLFSDQISEFNLLDSINILKVDKQTQRNLNQKIKGISFRQLIDKCLILQKTDDILIIKTNILKLEYYQIKVRFSKEGITLQLEDVKEFAKYVKKNSCFALMNKLFQSFSHEFGTLLNQIALISQNGQIQNPNMKEQFDLIYNCCVIMNNMVKDLKDFHQLRSKTFQLEIVDVNIDGLFNELHHLFKQQAIAKQISMFMINKVKIGFKQDEQRIKQILQNLIQNAIKYTNQDGAVYVTAEKYDEKRIKFSVLDSGIGISEGVSQNIKQMLSNDLILTSKISEGTAGLGLGLLNSNYLTKELSSFKQANKEFLQFSSKQGEGSNFWFYVWKYNLLESPSSQFENNSIQILEKKVFLHQKTNNIPPPPSLSNSKSCPSQFKRVSPKKRSYTRTSNQAFFPADVQEDNAIVIQEESDKIEDDPKPNHQSDECQCCKLLLVDDEPANLFPLKIMIKMLGYETDLANSGMQAINLVQMRNNQHCQYRLILMDINMPQMGGLETTRRIKIYNPNIIIVACSAFSDMQTKYEAQSAGMQNYLEKPINKESLKEILETYI